MRPKVEDSVLFSVTPGAFDGVLNADTALDGSAAGVAGLRNLRWRWCALPFASRFTFHAGPNGGVKELLGRGCRVSFSRRLDAALCVL